MSLLCNYLLLKWHFLFSTFTLSRFSVAGCDAKSVLFTLKDPRFTIKSNGVIETLTPVSVAAAGQTFSVWVQDDSGPGSEMEVHLVHNTMQPREVSLLMNVSFL